MFLDLFLKMFPPPRFLSMPHIGLDISDDDIHKLEFDTKFGHRYIKSFKAAKLPDGLIIGGDITDQDKLTKTLIDIVGKQKNGPVYAKVSIPEEKAYLFQTDVPSLDNLSIYQNIESKLEENVPLSAKDALFQFELLPPTTTSGQIRASVSVVPKTYVEHLSDILKAANITPTSFETVPTTLARILVPRNSSQNIMIANVMEKKTGLYIVSSGIVCFTSTITKNLAHGTYRLNDADALVQEISHISEYWNTRMGTKPIDKVILVGHDAPTYEKALAGVAHGLSIPISVANVWDNILSKKDHIPPISRDDSFDYAVAAGLAIQI